MTYKYDYPSLSHSKIVFIENQAHHIKKIFLYNEILEHPER